jgi:hypothetical protein
VSPHQHTMWAMWAFAGVPVIAALFVQERGCYAGVPGVDMWDHARDARQYAGPHPVVAHPPCTRWCRLAGLVEARWGYRRGDDGGCFASALESVRRWGGVLEHPAYTQAWPAFGLRAPERERGWLPSDVGHVAHVEQRHYGHRAKKATWLYAVGCDLPSLAWRTEPYAKSSALVSWCGNRVASGDRRPRLSGTEASATPVAFRDLLIDMARSVASRKKEVG